MTKLKILIADDEEALCELYQMILESEFSCSITAVHDGASAINLLKSDEKFDVLISDYNMPKANGGAFYQANKELNNIPFILLSGGALNDYADFKDFKETNPLNNFLGKPFNEASLIDAIKKISNSSSSDETQNETKLIKIKLSYYKSHSTNAAEIYIKLSDEKYVKITNPDSSASPDLPLLEHYSNKGIEYIYVEESGYQLFLSDIFKKFNDTILNEKKMETIFNVSGVDLKICVEGLNSIGISNQQIERTTEEIHQNLINLFNNSETKKLFETLTSEQGMIISHSVLLIYIAAALCKSTNLPVSSTMKKICTAAFYHDISMINDFPEFDENNVEQIKDESMLKLISEHPQKSANYLPLITDLADDIKKIILEHHELPSGKGYPRGLNASQISPLSCFFIISQLITLCLIRNNFSLECLEDFLENSKTEYNQGNFTKFYQAAITTFFPKKSL